MDQAAPYVASELTIEVQRDERGTVVVPHGEIDLANAADFEQAVFQALHDLPVRLAVDLSSLSFMDLVGVRALLRCRDQARRYDVPFYLVTGARGPYRLLALTGVLGEFDRDGAERDESRPRGGGHVEPAWVQTGHEPYQLRPEAVAEQAGPPAASGSFTAEESEIPPASSDPTVTGTTTGMPSAPAKASNM